ncbi:M48 family metalloprotease [Ascidiimonas sp. W6]|uniref:M48 family metalloprotease n=1 Tax=Ascidiimonas meishanensis TaxID=3128903 RepID=UPI0030ED5996
MKTQTTSSVQKLPFLPLINLLAFLLISTNSFSQKEEVWKEATIFELNHPEKYIVILFDNEEFKLSLSENVTFLKEKKKSVSSTEIFPGTTAAISFVVENRSRIVTKVLIDTKDESDDTFEGVFESLEDGIAVIDGRKVTLLPNTSIKCKGAKECNCSKGRSFLGFEELTMGSFLKVEATKGENGIYQAIKIEVCKNNYTKNDQQLMAVVAKSFDASNLNKISIIPGNIYAPANGLHKGNIKVGNIDYKLLDDIKLQGYINLVGNRVLPEYAKEESYGEKHNIYFRFYVIDNEVPNAMAFPNGMIFINTGLLKIMENEAQLATVLGHEIAHITHEHGAKRFKTTKLTESGVGKKGMKWLKNAVKKKTKVKEDGILGAAFDKALAYTTPKNIMNMFDKKKETQSDRVGLFYMHSNGYDAREAAKFWQNMMLLTKNESFMSSVTASTLEMVSAIDTKIEGKDFIGSLGEKGAAALVTQVLETIYTSHPRSVKRYGDINKLLATTYKNIDFDQYMIGKEDFEKYMTPIR